MYTILYVNYISIKLDKRKDHCISVYFHCSPKSRQVSSSLSDHYSLLLFRDTGRLCLFLSSALQNFSDDRVHKSHLFLPQYLRFHLCHSDIIFSCWFFYFILLCCLPESIMNALRGKNVNSSDASQEHWLLHWLFMHTRSLNLCSF